MQKNIESHLVEKRVFKPAKAFAAQARLKNLAQYRRMHRESIKNPEKFFSAAN
jgi:acetyl-CoA synthetase